ncbi:hypothetical protein COBT_001021, partial [Conglomerata obtusa]
MLEIPAEKEAYIQKIALKKTFELISFDKRRGIEEDDKEFEVGKGVWSMIAACQQPISYFIDSNLQIKYAYKFYKSLLRFTHERSTQSQ